MPATLLKTPATYTRRSIENRKGDTASRWNNRISRKKKKILIILKESIHKAIAIALSKGIRIPESAKCLLVECGILIGEIQNPELCNPKYSSRNPDGDPAND